MVASYIQVPVIPLAAVVIWLYLFAQAFGKFLDNDQGYGFAMTKGDQLIPAINAAVADMKQDGTIKTLYKKWWRGGNCMPKECEVVSGGTSLPLALRMCPVAFALCSVLCLF